MQREDSCQSTEWFDSVSRQYSKWSRTSYYTARTELSIFEDDEYRSDSSKIIENIDDVATSFETPVITRKSVSFKLLDDKHRSETVDISILQGSGEEIRNQHTVRNRSQSSPIKSILRNFKSEYEEQPLILPLVDLPMIKDRQDIFYYPTLYPPNIENDLNDLDFSNKGFQIEDRTRIDYVDSNKSIQSRSSNTIFHIRTSFNNENLASAECLEKDHICKQIVYITKPRPTTCPTDTLNYECVSIKVNRALTTPLNELVSTPILSTIIEEENEVEKTSENSSCLYCSRVCCFN
ncbi:uncharacterized protein CMU_037260 [Cryptosporidium muris RN66]|uniref:Uncharacterized protein n=1 Tax=Cryptosporidium muris (strain RN66) TaxID=441375 RepID=B6AH61_CRYMR|nr:uncharacterized protein CMU_037260 [Cryptosporidium muris RN66]EEA07552.1 hypothetical protein CMU_037260 [Cryptosporidium muris RN66]|eukprot:XP_002141901.1 hypothetical protein [Cryptosporidium muris RN66]